MARLSVSRTIYVNVDTPNLGFTHFNFLGGYQLKKHPVSPARLYSKHCTLPALHTLRRGFLPFPTQTILRSSPQLSSSHLTPGSLVPQQFAVTTCPALTHLNARCLQLLVIWVCNKKLPGTSEILLSQRCGRGESPFHSLRALNKPLQVVLVGAFTDETSHLG